MVTNFFGFFNFVKALLELLNIHHNLFIQR